MLVTCLPSGVQEIPVQLQACEEARSEQSVQPEPEMLPQICFMAEVSTGSRVSAVKGKGGKLM